MFLFQIVAVVTVDEMLFSFRSKTIHDIYSISYRKISRFAGFVYKMAQSLTCSTKIQPLYDIEKKEWTVPSRVECQRTF